MVEKIFFFDMDGTLLPHGSDQNISNEDVESLKKLESLGYEVVLNTGRSLSMCLDQLKQYDFKTCITSNGQSIIRNNEVIYEGKFLEEDVNYWIDYAKSNGLVIGFQTKDKQYILRSENVEEYRERCFGSLNMDMPTIVECYDSSLNVLQIWLIGEIDNLELRDDFDYFKWHNIALDVQLKGVSKGSGMNVLLDYLDCSNATIYAFGDSYNDLPMFELANISVALGNANNDVKSVANYVSKKVDDSGVSFYLKEHGLV